MPVLKKPRHEKFAAGIAARLSPREAYIQAGYSKSGADQSASRLLKTADIAARVKELSEEITKELLKISIADQSSRLKEMDLRWQLMKQIRDERAAEMVRDGKPVVPGAGTGLLVKTVKPIGQGKNLKVVYEYAYDAALWREMRALEESAREEIGALPTDDAPNFLLDLAEQVEDGPPVQSGTVDVSAELEDAKTEEPNAVLDVLKD